MAGVVAPSQDSSQSRLRGKKRAADSQLESEQRLSKRFDLLNLENGTRLYLPVAGSSDPALTASPRPVIRSKPRPIPTSPDTARKRERRRRRPSSDDCMHVEDTPDRVYIADLDAELSDIESDEDNPIFLHDIEKHLSKIPRHLLVGPEPQATKDNQLILYNVPSSLTVPEAQDSVRRAIVDARARLREKQANGPAMVPAAGPYVEGATAPVIPPPPASLDPDAMDLD